MAGVVIVGLWVFPSLKHIKLAAYIALVALTNISGAVGVLSTLAGTILIEREWELHTHLPEKKKWIWFYDYFSC